MLTDLICNKLSGVEHPRLVAGLDVSGWFTNHALDAFADVMASIVKKTKVEIHFIVFDDRIISQTKLEGEDIAAEIKKLAFASHGGTDFTDVIEHAVALDPSIIVILTDIQAPIGRAPGKVPVIWVTPEDDPPEVPFGQVVKLHQSPR